MNRKKTLALCMAISLIMGSCRAFAQTAEELLPKGIQLEEVQGELEKAIEVYQTIVSKYPSNRQIVAKALLHTGLCYEKLGKQDAQKTYQRIIQEFAEQNEVVAEARGRLSALERPEAAEPKGIAVREVWSDSSTDVCTAPSPDGRYFSYVDWDTGDLAVYELATGKKKRITNKGSWEKSDEFAEMSRWSPDSRQIVYAWYSAGDSTYELRIISLEDSEPRILYHNEEIAYSEPYDWSSDGKHILAGLDRKDGISQIVLISPVDGTVRVLKAADPRDPEKTMCFSPDGQYIAYNVPSGSDSLNHDISLLSVDGGREIPLVAHPANDYLLGWAPAGKEILFASDRKGSWDAWVIHIANGKPQGEPRLIKSGIGQIYPMGFTRKNSFFYFCSQGMEDAYVASLDPETGKILDPPKKLIERFEGHNAYPDYSPDGKYLAYTSTRGTWVWIGARFGGNRLCILSLETGKEKEFLPKFKRVSSPRWSPDGCSILVTGRDGNNCDGIYQFDVQTGDFKPVRIFSRGEESIRTHQWSRDGKSIFYVCQNYKTRLIQILVRDIESGAEKELYRLSVTGVRISISPDGKWLAVHIVEKNMKTRMVSIMPAEGGELRELYRWEQSVGYPPCCIWSADGRYILFAKFQEKTSDTLGDDTQNEKLWDLWRVPMAGGQPQKLGLGMFQFFNLSVHPDGRHIAFSSLGSTHKNSEVWVMENFLPESKAK